MFYLTIFTVKMKRVLLGRNFIQVSRHQNETHESEIKLVNNVKYWEENKWNNHIWKFPVKVRSCKNIAKRVAKRAFFDFLDTILL